MICRACSSSKLEFYFNSSSQLGNFGTFEFYKCKDCESLNLNANFDDSKILKFYENYPLFDIKKTWGKFHKFVEIEMKNVIRRRANFIKNFIELNNKRVLDVGCGDGEFLRYLRDNFHCEVEGVDIVKVRDDIKIYSSLSEIRDEFDIITAFHYIEHDKEPIETISKIKDLLKFGGYLIIETPKFPSLGFRIFKNRWAGLHTPRHYTIFSKQGLSKLLSSFNIILHSNFSSYHKFTLYGLSLIEPNEKNFIPWVSLMILLFPIYLFSNDIQFITARKL